VNKNLRNGLIIAAFSVILMFIGNGIYALAGWTRSVDARLARIEVTLKIGTEMAMLMDVE
jgi:hypothetical protein